MFQEYFGIPIYVVDLQSPEIISESEYINENIATAGVGEFNTPYSNNTWRHYHDISPNNFPVLADEFIKHANIFAKELDVKLEGWYTYWINQFYSNTKECSNDRHSHAKNKIIGVYYSYNNEPEGAGLVLENPIADLLMMSPYSDSYNSKYFKKTISIDAPQHRLILFPGFLWHWANFTNNVDAKRISLALEVN